MHPSSWSGLCPEGTTPAQIRASVGQGRQDAEALPDASLVGLAFGDREHPSVRPDPVDHRDPIDPERVGEGVLPIVEGNREGQGEASDELLWRRPRMPANGFLISCARTAAMPCMERTAPRAIN